MAQHNPKSVGSEPELNIVNKNDSRTQQQQEDKSMTMKPKFHYLKKLFMPWKWKKKKKSEKFRAISNVLERKMSTRISKDQLIEMGLIPPSYQGQDSSRRDNPCFDERGDTSLLESASLFTNNINNESYNEREVDRSWVSEVGVIPPPEMFSPRSSLDTKLTSLVSVMAVGEGLDLSDPNLGDKLLHFPIHDCDVNENPVDVEGLNHEHCDKEIKSTKLSKTPRLASVVKLAMDQHDNKVVLEVNKPAGDKNVIVNDGPNIKEDEHGGDDDLSTNSDMKRKNPHNDGTPTTRPALKDKPTNINSPKTLEEWRERREKIGRNLERRLSTRPSAEEMRERNLIPKLSREEKEDIKRRISIKLERRLSIRPTETDLKNRNILKQETNEETKQKTEETKNILQRKLSIRPSVAELKRRKILNFSEYIEVEFMFILDYDIFNMFIFRLLTVRTTTGQQTSPGPDSPPRTRP